MGPVDPDSDPGTVDEAHSDKKREGIFMPLSVVLAGRGWEWRGWGLLQCNKKA